MLFQILNVNSRSRFQCISEIDFSVFEYTYAYIKYNLRLRSYNKEVF